MNDIVTEMISNNKQKYKEAQHLFYCIQLHLTKYLLQQQNQAQTFDVLDD